MSTVTVENYDTDGNLLGTEQVEVADDPREQARQRARDATSLPALRDALIEAGVI